jgi:hypothetical protein
MRKLWLLLAALGCVTTPLSAQQPTFTDSLMDRMVGTWVLRGTIAGGQTTHDVTAEWVLQHQYVRVHEVARERDAAGKPAYEADMYIGWDAKARQYLCVWLDVFGGMSIESLGRATRRGDEIPFIFTSPEGREALHNTFAYDRAADRWEWRIDNIDASGAASPFARVTLTRQ